MNLEIEAISELVENSAVFASTGYSIVKVTRAGVPKQFHLPIKSRGVAEYQQKLSAKAPVPPIIQKLIRADSETGKAMGLMKDQPVMTFDYTDPVYIDALEKHNDDFSWRVAVFALDIKWTRADGTEAETFEDKKKILKGAGITGHQRQQIYADIQKLTQFTEEEIDFLFGG